MTPTADQIVVLTSTLQKLATKRVVASRNGPPVIEDYPRGSTHFRFEEWPVASFDEMAAALATLQAQPYSFVVRGAIIAGTDRPRAQRLQHAQRDKAGNVIPATLAPAARRSIAVDFDSIPTPAGIDPLFDPDAVVEYVVELLPEPFHGTSCFWYFTSGHGIKPGIRIRLWFWADRLVEDWELEAWLADAPVDLSIYRAANQPIYVARPIFFRMPDPVPYRHGIWRGYSDTVAVPAIEKPQARAASSSSTPGSGGGGYTAYREQIGDHDGGDGFYRPLKKAIGAYFGAHGGGADVEWLRADLEAAIRAAEHNRGAGYIEHRVRDLDPWIAWTREREQEKAGAQSRPIEPTYPAPMGSAEEARGVLAASVREFANEARAYRDYRDRLKAEGGETIPEPPPARGSSVGVGLGKTRSAREELVAPLTAEELPVVIAVPQHKLGDEFVRDLVQDGATGRVYRGRSANDPDAAGEKMCREHERATAIFNALGDVKQNACRSGDGAHQCEFFNICGYRKQMQAAPQTWVVPHQLLFHPRPKFISAPTALVIDESFYGASLHGTDRPIWLNLAVLLGDRTIPEQIYGRSAGATANLTAVSHRAYDAITAGADGWVLREALIAARLTADDLRNAQKLEWRRKLDLAEVLPGMPRREALAACKRIARHNQRVARLALLWRLLALQLEAGHERSPWLQFQHDAPLHDDDPGPGVRMTWRSDIHSSWRAPTLLLDATLQSDIDRVFFPLMGEPARIDAPMPSHVRVRQLTDRPMSHAMLVESETAGEKHNQARRNNVERLHRLIEVRAADIAPKHGVIIAQQHVEQALKAGKLPDNISVVHFNNVRGTNEWSKVAWLAVVGRTEPSPRDAERIARALFGVDVEEIPADEKGNVRYPQITRGVRMRDGTGRAVSGSEHPDPRVEAIRHAICESELVQAIGRGRGVNRDADHPLQIDVLTNIALPGIEVDEITTWDKIQPTAAEVMRARGAVPLGYADMAAAHRDLFITAGAAEQALRRENPLQTSIRIFLIDVCRGFLVCQYRKRGSRGPPGRLLYDPARIDPRAWLTERLGEVIVLPAAAEPAPRASPAARRCEWFIPDGPGKLRRCGVEIDPGMDWCPEHIRHSASITGYGRPVPSVSIPFFGDDVAEAAD